MASLNVVNVTGNSTLVFGGQGSAATPVQVVNNDANNSVYLAYSGNPSPGQAGVVSLGPGASMAFDGTVSVWAVTAGAGLTAEVSVIPGGSNYSPGALAISGPVTAEISGPVTVSEITTPVEVSEISGPVTVSSITAPVDIASVSGNVDIGSVAGNVGVIGVGGLFPVGGSSTLATGFAAVPVSTAFPVQVGDCSGYTAFNLLAAAYCTSQATAGAPLTCLVELQWFADAAYTIQIDDDAGWIWVTNSSTVNLTTAYVKGPMQGRYLQIIITNPSATEPLVCNYTLYGTGRSLSVSEWWQPGPVGGSMNSGVTMMLGAGISPTDGSADDILAALGATAVGASVTVWQPLPLKSPGLSSWNFVASVALSSFFALNMAAKLLNGQVSAGSPQPTTLWVPGNTAATNYTTQLALPHAPLYFVIHTTATAATVSVVASATDN